MDGFLGRGSLGVIAVLYFACKQFEVSSVKPQQIIKFVFENKEPGSMHRHITTAVLCSRLLISRLNFCFVIECEMCYFILVSSLCSFFSLLNMLAADTEEFTVPSSCLTPATSERLMSTVCIQVLL